LQLRRKTPLAVILLASVIFGAANFVSYRSQVSYIDNFNNEQLHDIAAEIGNGLTGGASAASTYAELVAALPAVRTALRARDRDGLLKELAPSYQNARAKYGAEQGSFQDPKLTTFLRLAVPTLSGDDVSHRNMIVRANQERQLQKGLETSSTRVSVRAVVPVMDGKEHLGSFEWGFGLSRLLLRIKATRQADVGLFVDEKMFSAPLTAKGAARIATVTRTTDVDRVVEGYRTLETSNVELMRHVVTLKLLAGLRDVSIRTRRVGGIDYGVIAIPINDFGGRRLGAILVAKSLAEPQRKVRVTQVTFLTVTAAGLILLAGAVQLVFNGLLLRPLLQIGDSLDELATGNYGASRDLLRRTDEIGAMAKNVDRIRERLAKEKEEAERKGRVAARLAALHDSEESS
jgi:methyl-accepting chemotaxis protein